MMEERKSPPILLAILLALLGLSVLPKGGPGEAPSPNVAPAEIGGADTSDRGVTESTASSRAIENPDLAVLAPLIDVADDGSGPRIDEREGHPPPKFADVGPGSLVHEVVEQLRRQGDTARAMIALLPDPVRTSVSQDFDSQLDGHQRAAEAAGFVLNRHRFPWDKAGRAERPSAGKPRDAVLEWSLPDQADRKEGVRASVKLSHPEVAAPWRPTPDDQPGLLVFRKLSGVGRQEVLAVFLVLETPTQGLNKHQLNWSLDLLDAIADAGGAEIKDSARLIPILGPRYTGTQSSLKNALDGWLTSAPSERGRVGQTLPPLLRRSYRFSIAAAATEIDAANLIKLRSIDPRSDYRERLSRQFPGQDPKPATVIFGPSHNGRSRVADALRKYLGDQFGGSCKLAMLVESNTVFGVNVKSNDLYINDDIYNYPLHIASLRADYEKQGLLRDPGGTILHPAGQLVLSPDDVGRPRDVVGSATPGFSTRVDELVMVQLMTEIAHKISLGRYDAVGIAGTSSRDIIFLAQMVRRYCPDAVIFTNMTDLLFTQPQSISDLRGMLVGSSYPLYAPNRVWSYPYGAGPDAFFNHDSVQAYYNATMAHLRQIFPGDEQIKQSALPLEFGRPFRPPHDPPRPPIWIGVVGNRGIYPLRVIDAPDPSPDSGEQPLFTREDLEAGVARQLPGLDISALRYQPSYHMFWMVLEGLLLSFVLVMFALAVLELCWVIARLGGVDLGRKRGWRALEPLALFLVWSRDRNFEVPGRPHITPGHGPGFFLVLGHLALFFVYVAINRPFLVRLPTPLAHVGWIAWEEYARAGYWVALASLGVSVLSWSLLNLTRFSVEKSRPSIAKAIALIVAFLGMISWLWDLSYDPTIDPSLALERLVTVTSGVSPTFPLLFVGLGAASFLVSQLKRRYLNEQFSIKDLLSSGENRPDTPADPMTDVERKIDGLRGMFHHPLRVFSSLHPIPTLCLVIYAAALGLIGISHVIVRGSPEGRLYNVVFWGFFTVLSGFLAFHVYLVFVIWSELRVIMAQVARLPLTRSFEKMPTRVARWFFEAPIPQNRSMMVEGEAIALAERCGPSPVMTALERLCPSDVVTRAEWDALPGKLRRINVPTTPADGNARRGRISVMDGSHPVARFLSDTGAYLVLLVTNRRAGRGGVAKGGSPDGPGKGPVRAGSTAAAIEGQGTTTGTGDIRPTQDRSDVPAGATEATGTDDVAATTVSAGANEILNKILQRVWEGTPLTWTYAEGKAGEDARAEAASGWPIAPKTKEALTGEALTGKASGEKEALTGGAAVVDAEILEGVRKWTAMAEDLIALQLLRHLSHFLAQLWVMAGFIMFGSFTLLFAINSYPFPTQNRVEFFLAVLIAVAASVILRLVVGINRDETISRVGNTMPGFKLDRDLAGSLVGYILPLLGILAAISYDVSDLLRVWLDPLFRNLM